MKTCFCLHNFSPAQAPTKKYRLRPAPVPRYCAGPGNAIFYSFTSYWSPPRADSWFFGSGLFWLVKNIFLLYKDGSSNRLSVSIRCYYPIILSSLIHGKPDFVSFPVSIFTGTGQILGYMWLRIRVFIQLIMLLFTRYKLMEAFCKLKLELPSYIRFGL